MKPGILVYALLAAAPIMFGVSAQLTGTAQSIGNALCGIVAIISNIVGVLAILMFVLGGTLYGFAHFMPASGNIKGSMQGWGMGILMGSIVMLILYLLAPFIITRLIAASQGSNSALPAIQNIGCNSAGQAVGGVTITGSGAPAGSQIPPNTLAPT